MNGAAFLNLAFQLASASDEPRLRTAVSRAYYGAFHQARELLRDAGVHVPSSEQVHRRVFQVFSNAGHPSTREAGKLLDSLKAARNVADYDLESTAFQAADGTRLTIDSAKRVVELIHDCRTGVDRETIRVALRQSAGSLGLPVAP